jgi:hypothetical protein
MALRFTRDALSYAVITNTPALRLTNEYSLGMQFRVRSQPDTGEVYTLLSKGSITAGDSNYQLEYYEDSGVYYIKAGHSNTGASQRSKVVAQTLLTGQWYAIAVTHDDAGDMIYIYLALRGDRQGNGAETTYTEIASGAVAGTPFTNPDDVYLGIADNAGTLENGADVDTTEAVIFEAVLSKATWDGYLGTRRTGSEANLIGYWRADDGLGGVGGITVYDRSGAGHDGTLTGAPAESMWVACPADLLYDTGTLGNRPLIAHHNACWVPGAGITPDEEATGYEAIRAFANPRQSLTTRTSDVAGAKRWVIDLGAPHPVQLLALEHHNLTSKATILLEAHTSDAWGGPSLSQAITYHPGFARQCLERPSAYRFWRLSITDAANGAGYLELGLLALWTYPFQSSLGAAGETLTLRDVSTAVATRHGDRVTRDLEKFEAMAMPLDVLRASQGLYLRQITEDLDYCFVCQSPQTRLVEGVYGLALGLPSYGNAGDSSGTHRSAQGLAVVADHE